MKLYINTGTLVALVSGKWFRPTARQFCSNRIIRLRDWLLLALLVPVLMVAQIPPGYYHHAEGKQDATLKTALHAIIRPHTQLEYYSSSTYFRTTDWHPDGYFWDMYSREKRSTWTNLNREHAMPKSWWSTQPEYTVAYSDLHNLYPSNPEANSAKSNYPLGEVGLQYEYDNGVTRVGMNTYPGYRGLVFEPLNEYKGDFARTYMYMVACYEDYAPNWRSTGTSSMLFQNTYPTFQPYAVSLLMKWHREDPVSQKEIDRNNAVHRIQGNRNPFIDYPLLAEHIWGKSKGVPWSVDDEGGTLKDIMTISYQYSSEELLVRLSPAAEVPYRIYSIEGRELVNGMLSGALTTRISLQGKLNDGVYLFVTDTQRQRHAVLFVVL
jgi:endonuclease I